MRPQKFNADYFPHFTSMRNDRKIKALRTKYSFKGYAIYNMILELLADSNGIIVKWTDDEIELIAGDFNLENKELDEIVKYMVSIKLFEMENEYLICPALERSLVKLFEKRRQSPFDYRKQYMPETVIPEKTQVSDEKTPQSKVEKKKGDEKEPNKIKDKEKEKKGDEELERARANLLKRLMDNGINEKMAFKLLNEFDINYLNTCINHFKKIIKENRTIDLNKPYEQLLKIIYERNDSY